MEDDIRRKHNKFKGQDVYFVNNAADFPSGSPGDAAAVINRAVIEEMNELDGQQVSGGSSAAQFFGNKEEDLDAVWLTLKRMNRAANIFGDEVQGIEDKFRLPRNRSQANILAAGRAYHADSVNLVEQFKGCGLEANFRATLLAQIAKVEQDDAQAESGVDKRGGATAGLIDAARRGMQNSRKMDSIVRIKYENNPQKLAEWEIASHLEKAPKRAKDTPTP
jgi:hypothetical protein